MHVEIVTAGETRSAKRLTIARNRELSDSLNLLSTNGDRDLSSAKGTQGFLVTCSKRKKRGAGGLVGQAIRLARKF